MTIETTLQVSIGGDPYVLKVKMIRIESINYFFISDMENDKKLLGEQTLELTYTDSFSLTEFAGVVRSPGVPGHIVLAIERELLKNERTWFH